MLGTSLSVVFPVCPLSYMIVDARTRIISMRRSRHISSDKFFTSILGL